ncbi:hypothetical protein P9847_06775 [Paenibacillus chibensis]|uniref:DUF3796 domain-containing protein n=1 Tax=Paenibacillus chibensis TaxID=59846 RepID=A0ABU6PQ57_9BACL|nr:hypothetical protein [Paenibacillus chibensis]
MGFIHLLWGFLFLIDIRINGIDVLPDVIGYVLFFLGFAKLENKSRHFRLAKNMSVVMIAISVMSLLISWASVHSWLLYFVVNLVVFVLKVYIIFHLCYGISDMAGRRGLHEFQNKAVQRWRWFIAVIAASFILILLAPLLSMLAILFAFLLMIASVVIYVMMMMLMWEAEHVFQR